ncbi:MAG: TolC family protein [Ruminiclostridium sp.]|jgi:chromosome segregation ATPase|nr:TolC family protein [Ruminiclostridium sp.]
MKKQALALCLSCALALSMSTPALALRVNTAPGPKPSSNSTNASKPSDTGSLTFSQIGARIEGNNLNIKSAKESLESAKAMDWNAAIREVEDMKDELEFSILTMSSSAQASVANATKALESIKANITDADSLIKMLGPLTEAITGVSTAKTMAVYIEMQTASMKANVEALDDQIDDLKQQKKDYTKTLEDTSRQIDFAIDQTVTGAETLYITILSTQLQRESLVDTLESTKRTAEEMELRYNLGQISQLTLTQVKNGLVTLESSLESLDNSIATLKSSLQSLLGDTPNGVLALTDTPSVTPSQLILSYSADLVKAKSNSYTLYASTRSVEKAEDEMNDARSDHGKNSYQFKMAEHSYQAAIYKDQATIADFELSFQKLYQAIPPAQTALAVKENDLLYAQQSYAAEELKFQQGNLSQSKLLEAKATVDSAQRDVAAAQLDLFTAYHNYRQAVEQGLVGG